MQGHNWSELRKVHLDLRQPLRLIQRVHPGRHCRPVSRNGRRPIREQAYALGIVDRSNAWLQFFRDVGGYDLCRSIARYHPAIQYHALWYASRCARLASLAESNPGLFVGVILLAQTEPSDPHAQLTVAQQLAQGREREISERLGYERHGWRS